MYISRPRSKYFLPVILFLIWPFAATVLALKNHRTVWAKNLFWLFCIFFGFVFIIPNEGPDAARYFKWFQDLYGTNVSVGQFTNYLYSQTTGYVDIYQPLVTYFVSRFTNNSHILFALFGLVYGFFYSRNIWSLLDRIRVGESWITIIIVLAFGLLMPIWNINGVRFWTAAQVFLYGVLAYILNNDKRKVWISFLAVFVHFSFFLPLLVIVIYLIAGNRPNLYFSIFIVSIFIRELDLNLIKDFIRNLPVIFQNKGELYLNEGSIEEGHKLLNATNWYVKYYSRILNWLCYVFLIGFFIKERDKVRGHDILNNLFCFSILYYAFANFANLLPLGDRFYQVGNMLVLFILAYSPFKIRESSFTILLKNISVLFLLYAIVVNIRRGFDYTGLVAIIGNPIVSFLFEDNVPLIDLVKQIF